MESNDNWKKLQDDLADLLSKMTSLDLARLTVAMDYLGADAVYSAAWDKMREKQQPADVIQVKVVEQVSDDTLLGVWSPADEPDRQEV